MNEEQPITVEAAPTQALVVHQQQAVTSGLFGTTEPKEVITKAAEVATALKEVVVKQGLVSNINGKQYPRCEAWTLLGTMLGVFPVMVWTKPVEGGWEARVEARTKDGAIVGAAEAECLRKEKNWANRDDFALRSMAQTRATAKCLRMPLGFVMTLSGFEATPAEEMVMDHPQAPQTKKGSQSATPPIKTPPKPSKAQKEPSPEQCREKLVKNLDAAKLREKASQYLIDLAWMLPTESLETLELRYVPLTKEEYVEFIKKLTAYAVSGKAEKPYDPHFEADPADKPIEVPRDKNMDYDSPDAPWRSFPVPFGKNAGTKLADLDKAVLYGFWANYEPQEEWEDKNGNVRKTKPEKLAKDRHFREMLDEAGKHYEFKEPEDKP